MVERHIQAVLLVKALVDRHIKGGKLNILDIAQANAHIGQAARGTAGGEASRTAAGGQKQAYQQEAAEQAQEKRRTMRLLHLLLLRSDSDELEKHEFGRQSPNCRGTPSTGSALW